METKRLPIEYNWTLKTYNGIQLDASKHAFKPTHKHANLRSKQIKRETERQRDVAMTPTAEELCCAV